MIEEPSGKARQKHEPIRQQWNCLLDKLFVFHKIWCNALLRILINFKAKWIFEDKENI